MPWTIEYTETALTQLRKLDKRTARRSVASSMNAEHLLTHFDRLADAPDAIPRLRRFILDLAVRGKLEEQDPEDEPASELLKRIAVEKRRMGEAGEIRKGKVLPTIEVAETPFSIPAAWRWIRFGNIADFSAGRTPPRNELAFWNTGDYPWISIADMNDGEILMATRETVSEESAKKIFRSDPEQIGTMIMSFKLTIGKIARLGVPAYHNEAIISIRPYVSEFDPYLFKVLPFFARRGDTKGAIKGATLNRESISNIPIPLPPLVEQHRIVAKVDELMALCDRLETTRKEQETTRDRLATASLTRLNAPDPDPAVFQNHTVFVLDNLTPLTTRPDQIKALRQTILNLAVRGKLVDQAPEDEPAGELLRRIAEERIALEKSGSIKKSKPLPPVNTSDAPFNLPASWTWARFPEIGIFGRGKSKHRPRNDPVLYEDGTYPFIQTGDVARSSGSIETYGSLYNDVGLAQSAMWPAGTLCITIAANIADSGILTFDACFPDSVVGLIVHDSFEDARFFEYFLRTAKNDLREFAPSTAQKNINLGILMDVLIPLPPLAEQRRIVAKVDELMAVCDRLEASLARGEETRVRLVEAVLCETLEAE